MGHWVDGYLQFPPVNHNKWGFLHEENICDRYEYPDSGTTCILMIQRE